MKKVSKWLNKKGLTTDAFVIILLVVGLAIAVSLLVYFITRGQGSAHNLFNLSSGLEETVAATR